TRTGTSRRFGSTLATGVARRAAHAGRAAPRAANPVVGSIAPRESGLVTMEWAAFYGRRGRKREPGTTAEKGEAGPRYFRTHSGLGEWSGELIKKLTTFRGGSFPPPAR